MSKNNLILLLGVQGSGKDYYATNYKGENVFHLKFTNSIRSSLSPVVGVDLLDENIYSYWKSKPENRMKIIDYTVKMKEIYGDSIFVIPVLNAIDHIFSNIRGATVIISDFRFPIEYFHLSRFCPKIVFCNYKSERYGIFEEQEPERMAIDFIKLYPLAQHGQDITNYIKDIYVK